MTACWTGDNTHFLNETFPKFLSLDQQKLVEVKVEEGEYEMYLEY